jgi:putative Holliday junction resolvase
VSSSRVLGIDYGTARIGVSLSDPLGIIAQPLETLKNDATAIERLAKLIKQHGATLVVVGMPLNLKGQKAHKAQEVEQFVARLKDQTGVAAVLWDERFTSTIAQQTLLSLGTKKKERRTDKGRVDAMAAAIILQSFLDSAKRSMSC